MILKIINIIIKFNLIGKRFFQAKYINLSQRNRGKIPRTQIKKKDKKHPFKLNSSKFPTPPKNNKEIRQLIKIILAYSAKNNKAKPPLPYSTLNPDTNSDSPSAKSKGVRLVSANIVTNQQRNKGKNKIKKGK